MGEADHVMPSEGQTLQRIATIRQRVDREGGSHFEVYVDARVIDLAHKLSELLDEAKTHLLPAAAADEPPPPAA